MSTLKRFVLFDLDGTLIDGVADLLMAMNQLLGEESCAPVTRPALEGMLGDGVVMLTRRAFAASGRPLDEASATALSGRFMQHYRATDYAQTRLFEGMEQVLTQLHDQGWQIGLASNKPTTPCERILQRLGVGHLFRVIAGGDATGVKKPDGGHLQFALAAMDYCPEQGDVAVMVGDHANDVDAARAFGIPAIAVAFYTDAARASSLGAEALVTRVADLPATLERI